MTVLGVLLVTGDAMWIVEHSSLPDSLPKVCGSDGRIYNNRNELELIKHIKRSEGKEVLKKYLAVLSENNEDLMYLMLPYNAYNVQFSRG
jgi:hypothetical protein